MMVFVEVETVKKRSFIQLSKAADEPLSINLLMDLPPPQTTEETTTQAKSFCPCAKIFLFEKYLLTLQRKKTLSAVLNPSQFTVDLTRNCFHGWTHKIEFLT
ncbi:unnamed protein product [Allacma fusca]|uniref:Uncharacterized protein n=1 Tax=Allacma fusca TaxID=39272 RepID=A0A8J2KVW7_9HEXA|nr:unnamed protein product [Allacma fusca]